jgi:hypothetical protein
MNTAKPHTRAATGRAVAQATTKLSVVFLLVTSEAAVTLSTSRAPIDGTAGTATGDVLGAGDGGVTEGGRLTVGREDGFIVGEVDGSKV